MAKTHVNFEIELKTYIDFKKNVKNKGLKLGYVMEQLVIEWLKNNKEEDIDDQYK